MLCGTKGAMGGVVSCGVGLQRYAREYITWEEIYKRAPGTVDGNPTACEVEGSTMY